MRPAPRQYYAARHGGHSRRRAPVRGVLGRLALRAGSSITAYLRRSDNPATLRCTTSQAAASRCSFGGKIDRAVMPTMKPLVTISLALLVAAVLVTSPARAVDPRQHPRPRVRGAHMNPVLALARPEIRDLKAYAHAAWLPSMTRLHANEVPWRPQFSLSAGLSDTIAWWRAQLRVSAPT